MHTKPFFEYHFAVFYDDNTHSGGSPALKAGSYVGIELIGGVGLLLPDWALPLLAGCLKT